MAYLVAQRTGEIGIRVALGASRADVLRLIVGRGVWMAGIGIVIGLAEVLAAGYESSFASFLGAGIHEITPYIIMILVLLIRPYGLFGTRKVERI